MDKRKLITQNEELISEVINNKTVNLELANCIETIEDLRQILQANANTKYFQTMEGSKINTIFSKPTALDTKPRTTYVLVFGFAIILYRRGVVSRMAFVYAFLGLSLYTALRNLFFVRSTNEYADFRKCVDNYKKMIKIKNSFLSWTDKAIIISGSNFKGIDSRIFLSLGQVLI